MSEMNVEVGMPQNYWIICFKCGKSFLGYTEETQNCPRCGFTICPHCRACKCSLSKEEALIVDRMWETSRPIVQWWLHKRDSAGKEEGD